MFRIKSTRESRSLTRWDLHAVARRRRRRKKKRRNLSQVPETHKDMSKKRRPVQIVLASLMLHPRRNDTT